MAKILKFLRSIWAPFILLVVVAAVTAIFGKRWGIPGPWPYVIAGAIVLLALVVLWVWWLIERQKDRQFESGILRQAQEDMSRASVARRGEMENLVQRWKESVRLLKDANARGQASLHRLPWFMVLGESGSGKSTLIKNSGLDFPVGDAKIRGIGGTKNCDWWFANEAIILDTAGRYAFEVQSAPDREEWERFLGLVKKTRRRRPINGLLVAIPTDTLLQRGEEELAAYGQHLRGKINDIMQRLGIVFPVYVVITKVDLAEGFVRFFQRYPANRVREAVGRTFTDLRPRSCVQAASRTLDDLYARLCSMSLGLLNEEDPGAPARPLLMHPEEFKTLGAKIGVLLESLFRENVYMGNPVFRGLYLTSGTQEGRTITSAFQQMAANLRLDSNVLTTQFGAELPRRAYFVRDLLSKILVEDSERGLVQPLAMGPRQQLAAAIWRVIVPASLAALVFLAWSLGSWASNRSAWRALADGVKKSEFLRRPPAAAGRMGEAVSELAGIARAHANAAGRSSFWNLLLNRRDPKLGDFLNAYRKASEDWLIDPALRQVKDALETGSPSSWVAYLEDLNGYVAYRRALVDRSLIDEESHRQRLAALLGPLKRPTDKEGLASKGPDFVDLLSLYVQVGPGAKTGGVSFRQVGTRLRDFEKAVRMTDPVPQLRDVGRRAGAALASGSVHDLWGELRALASAGTGGGGHTLDPLVNGIEKDLRRIGEEARDAAEAMAALRPVLIGSGGALDAQTGGGSKPQAFAEQVRRPLQALMDFRAPGCEIPSSADPATIEDFSKKATEFSGEIARRAEELRRGIDAFNNAFLSPSERIDAAPVAELATRARVGEAMSCVGSWFDPPDGPLSSRKLADEVGGVAGAPEFVYGAGQPGLFKCLFQKPSAGGGGGDPEKVKAIGSAVAKLAAVPEVPPGLKRQIEDRWSQVRDLVARPSGPVDWTRALDMIELSRSPETWTLDTIPDAVANDVSLATILGTIEGGVAGSGGNLRPFQRFDASAYAAALTRIGEEIRKAKSDRLQLSRVAGDAGLFEPALQQARNAPSERLQGLLLSVPETIRRKLGGEAPQAIEAEWRASRDVVRAAVDCYPFKSGGADCEVSGFDAVFGPGGVVERLAGAAQTAGLGPGFRRFLQAGERIRKAYGQPDGSKAFSLTFLPRAVRITPFEKIDEDDIGFSWSSYTITLNNTKFDNRKDETQASVRGKISLREDGESKIEVALADLEGKKKRKYRSDDVTMSKPPQRSGPWSFLRLLQKDGRAQAGEGKVACTWDLAVTDKNKTDRKVATIRIVYELDARSGGSVLDPGFWQIEVPGSTTE